MHVSNYDIMKSPSYFYVKSRVIISSLISWWIGGIETALNYKKISSLKVFRAHKKGPVTWTKNDAMVLQMQKISI